MELLYRALRGSRLHGDESPDSDRDYFIVFRQEGKNFYTWKQPGVKMDRSGRGIGYFLAQLRRNSLQTMEALWAEEKTFSPEFQHYIFKHREEFQDTEAFALAYEQDMVRRRRVGDFKWLLHGIGYSNFVAGYFDRGAMDPRIGWHSGWFTAEYSFSKRDGAISLEDFDAVVDKTKKIIAASPIHKKRNESLLEDAAKYFLTPAEYAVWSEDMSNK